MQCLALGITNGLIWIWFSDNFSVASWPKVRPHNLKRAQIKTGAARLIFGLMLAKSAEFLSLEFAALINRHIDAEEKHKTAVNKSK
jgi:hypothetical protein